MAAVLSAQTAFFGHDAGHKQISASAKVDRRLGLVAANLLNGISYGWWQDKHLRHHAHPNEVGLDPDVGESLIAWTERQAAEKKAGQWLTPGTKLSYSFPCWHARGWQLSVAGIRALGQRPRQSRLLESGLLAGSFSLFRIPVCVLDPAQAVVFCSRAQGVVWTQSWNRFCAQPQGHVDAGGRSAS